MGATKLGLTEEELPPLVQMWRNASPHIVQFWWDIDRAAKECIKTHLPQTTHGMKFIYCSGCMFLRLRSGRNLCYPQPKIGTNRFGSESITFMGINTVKKWSRIETYRAKLVENIVKAASHDLLAEAMRRLEATGNSIVMHIHDEAVIDAPADRSLEKIVKIMTDDYNPRKDLQPGDLDYEKLKRSMKEFGYVDPIIWNQQTGHVVGGHQRSKILQDEGIKEAECVVVNLGEEKEKALNIALNKISGDWDKDKLALLMTDLLAAEDESYESKTSVEVVKHVRKYVEKHTNSNPWKYYESTMESIIANHVENMTDLENYNYRLAGKKHKPVQQQLPLLSVVNNNGKKYKTKYYHGKLVEQGTDWSKKKAKTYTAEELDAQARNSLHMKPDEPFTGKWATMTPAERSAEALHECFVALEKGVDL